MHSRKNSLVALVDVGITEWRGDGWSAEVTADIALHSLMSALPNGGGSNGQVRDFACYVALVDVGITEWRFFCGFAESYTIVLHSLMSALPNGGSVISFPLSANSVALVDVGITEWRLHALAQLLSLRHVALVDVGITEWRVYGNDKTLGFTPGCTR